MGRFVNVAIIQTQASSYQLKQNLEDVKNLLHTVLHKGAKIILLPELFDSGYCVEDRDAEFAIDFSNPEHATLQTLIALAKEYKAYIIGCSIQKRGKSLFDTAYIIAEQGIIGSYDKVYLWGNEPQRFSRGNAYPVFELDVGFKLKLGLQICYEVGFPEGARFLSLQGAELICYTAAYSKARRYAWDLASRARALENGCFVLACNRSGSELSKITNETLHFGGKSKIINPQGAILQELLEDTGYITDEIDIDMVQEQRKAIPYLRDLDCTLSQKILQNITKP